MKCFYHVDADGKCAGYWVYNRYPNMNPEDFIKIDYGMSVDPVALIEKDEPVIVVDFSFEPEVMDKVLDKSGNVTWIDHHMTAINKYSNYPRINELKGLRYDGIAGCMLTWAYYNKMNDGRLPFDKSMCTEAPWMTKYIHDNDVWLHEYGEETECFRLGFMTLRDTNPTSDVWKDLLDHSNVLDLIRKGEVIVDFRDHLGSGACNTCGFEYELKGYNIFCLNIIFGGSQWFGDLMDKYDAVCSFNYNGKEGIWEYSLYSQKIDTSKISVSYGGGGHAGASGFQTKECIFSK